MKIVQSLWSKPAVCSQNDSKGNLKRGETGGWLQRKTYFQSWALSCLRLRKYYDELELVTDTEGKEMLIDLLKLPYTSCRLDLDGLKDNNSDLWALGKIYAYSIQERPFLHVDSDVYVWGRFPEVDQTPLLVQNYERHPYYNKILREFKSVFSYFPDCMENLIDLKEALWCVNAGILGGNNCSFFKEYTQEAITFISNNEKYFSQINTVEFNIVFEQILFYYLARENSYPIRTLFEGVFDHYGPWIVNFKDAPKTTKYIHAVGVHKKNEAINNLVSDSLERDFPEFHHRIEDIFR